MRRRGKIDHAKPTALYRLFDAADQLLYVGIAFVPETRWRRHAKTEWGPLIARREAEWFPDRRSARAVELHLIRTLQPPHNIAETPRKRWKAGMTSSERSVAKRRPLPAKPTADASDIMVRLARAARREALAAARVERAIAAEYQGGTSLRDIAEQSGLSHEGVRKILAKAGVPLRGRGRPAKTGP